jgi:tripartite-type tricarboxylate transporter receptor subunit TctC
VSATRYNKDRKNAMITRRMTAVVLGLFALGGPAAAQDTVADFYRGKQIRIIVGSDAGSGYDVYARLLARHMGEHIPGNPSIIVQNMPGAGGLSATNHLYARASRDGLTIGAVQGSLTFAQVGKSPNALFDMRKFGWLGSANNTSNTCVFSPRAGIASARDLLDKKVVIGASGGSTDFVPNLLNALIKTRFDIVKGYKSTSAILPAIERGEVDGICGWGWDSAQVNGRDYFARGVFAVGLENANERHPELAARGVPFALDLAKDSETKDILRFVFSYLVYVRPFIVPPEVPADRLEALQKAFAAALKDADLLAEAEKSSVEVRYVSPEQAKAALAQAFDAPEAIKERGLEELRKAGWQGL